VDSQWLFQLVLYAADSAGGSAGVVALGVLLAGALSAALVAACRGRERSLVLVLGVPLFAVFLSYHRFIVRPELVSLAFLAIFALASERFDERPRAWLVALPLLQVVWTNCHGLSILGPVYLGLGFAGDVVEAVARRLRGAAREKSPASPDLRRRGALMALCVLALLANANGWPGIRYPLELFRELRGEVPWFPAELLELRSPFAVSPRSILDPIALYPIFVVCSLAAIAIGWRRVHPADLIRYAAFLYLSAGAIRNIPLFAIATAPIVARALHRDGSTARDEPSSRDPRIAFAACAGIAAVAAATWIGVTTNSLYRDLGWSRRFGFGEYEHVPPEIVERLRTLDGRFLNDSAIGGYLIWKLYPDKQVAMDGRWEVYGDLLPRLRTAFRDPNALADLVREFDIRAVVMSNQRLSNATTVQMFAHLPGFRLVVRTPDGALYERVADSR